MPRRAKTTDEFIQSAIGIHGDRYDYSKAVYIKSGTKIIITCRDHGDFLQAPNNHLRGINCPICGTLSQKTKIKLNTGQKFIKRSSILHDYKYDYDNVDYIDWKTPVCIICPKHGQFYQHPNNHLRGYGCPNCKTSKGELLVKKFLDDSNIVYTQQHTFKTCRNKRPLPFDFYLPELNVCIEYDGIQHFKSVPLFGGDTYLSNTIHRDNIKSDYCVNNNIKLIRVRYDEDVMDKLSKLL